MFLEQFGALSYGDHLFCCFVLLPLQQQQPAALRRLLWEEHPHILRFLSISPDQVHTPKLMSCHASHSPHPMQIPLDLKAFLQPPEEDSRLLNAYRSCLDTGTIRSAHYKCQLVLPFITKFCVNMQAQNGVHCYTKLLSIMFSIQEEKDKKTL